MQLAHGSPARPWRARVGSALSDYGPSAGLFIAGFPIVFDYGRTERLDLLLGGVLVSLLGIVLADHVSGSHFSPALLRRALGGRIRVYDKFPLVAVGLATAFTLCTGEAMQWMARHGASLEQCLDPCTFEEMVYDPSALKIVATAFLFPAASLINIPGVHARLERLLTSLHIKCLQNILSGGGSVLIGAFGLFVHAFSAIAFGVLCGSAHLIALIIRSYALHRARASKA